jgi:hypothetical protein
MQKSSKAKKKTGGEKKRAVTPRVKKAAIRKPTRRKEYVESPISINDDDDDREDGDYVHNDNDEAEAEVEVEDYRS